MLLQSHAGEIAILPALPSAWPSGAVTGLRSRGAIGVDIRWDGGKATEVRLRPDVDAEPVIRPPKGQRIVGVSFAGRSVGISTNRDGTVRVQLGAGNEYEVTFSPSIR